MLTEGCILLLVFPFVLCLTSYATLARVSQIWLALVDSPAAWLNSVVCIAGGRLRGWPRVVPRHWQRKAPKLWRQLRHVFVDYRNLATARLLQRPLLYRSSWGAWREHSHGFGQTWWIRFSEHPVHSIVSLKLSQHRTIQGPLLLGWTNTTSSELLKSAKGIRPFLNSWTLTSSVR